MSTPHSMIATFHRSHKTETTPKTERFETCGQLKIFSTILAVYKFFRHDKSPTTLLQLFEKTNGFDINLLPGENFFLSFSSDNFIFPVKQHYAINAGLFNSLLQGRLNIFFPCSRTGTLLERFTHAFPAVTGNKSHDGYTSLGQGFQDKLFFTSVIVYSKKSENKKEQNTRSPENPGRERI